MKDRLKYLPLKWLLEAVARLPFWAGYLLADFLYFLLYYIARYRRKVVSRNLEESFPDLSAKERNAISRRFFQNLADYIFETVKLLHISDEAMRRRMTFTGVEIIDNALRRGRPVVCYFAHIGNWEWAPSITLWSSLTPGTDAQFCQVYRPLRNAWTDAMMLRIRSRFGAVSLPKRRAFLDLLRYRRDGMPTVTGFMSDQKPSHGDTMHVIPFLNHPTAIITGTEIVARRLDALPVYWRMSKPSRGHYHIDVIDMSTMLHEAAKPEPAEVADSKPADSDQFPLTDAYARLLEANIKADPSLWLWSHKRWKNPVSYDMNNQKVK